VLWVWKSLLTKALVRQYYHRLYAKLRTIWCFRELLFVVVAELYRNNSTFGLNSADIKSGDEIEIAKVFQGFVIEGHF
jgi:hypothetical protein